MDSLEDEHVRRAVHTTKTQADIEKEQERLEGGMSCKANKIAQMFVRKRGRTKRGGYSSSYK